MSGQIEMPKYKSHKEVWALKIKSVDATTITPADNGYAPFEVPEQYIAKHDPKAGGYYVVYEDGYQSFSPADAFEGGYTLATRDAVPVVDARRRGENREGIERGSYAMTEREQFEAAMSAYCDPVKVEETFYREGDGYEAYATLFAWYAWQAARATAEQSNEATVPYSLYVAGCRDFERVAERCDDAAEIISALQKALAYWMPTVFDERSAHDAYLLMGYNGENEPSYWDAHQSPDSVIEQCAKVVDSYADRALDCDPQFALDLCSDAVRALKSQQDAAIEAKTAEQSVRDAALFDILMRKNIELTDEAYLSMRVVGVPPSEGEFVAALKKAIDAAIESQQGDGS